MRDYVETLWTMLWARVEPLRRNPEAGYSTEAVLVTALLVVLAIAALTLLANLVISKVQSIQL